MTLPSRIAAVVLLLAALGIVFVLVSNAGVSTKVFLSDPTATALPPANAENWAELMTGQLAYQSNPQAPFQAYYNTIGINDFAATNKFDPPAADSPHPLLDLLTQLRTVLEGQIANLGLTAPDAFTGPQVEDMGGTPVTTMRVIIAPQKRADGQDFKGMDLYLATIDQGDGNMTLVQYVAQGVSDPVAFQDFHAWLEQNAARLAVPTPEATAEATEAAPSGTEEAAPAATQEAAPAGTEAAPLATEQAVPAGTEAAPAATQEAAPQATEAAVPPAPVPADPPSTEVAAPAGTAEAAAPSTTWAEFQPGSVLYAADPQIPAQIVYSAMPLDSFAQSNGLQAPAEDSQTAELDLLNQLKPLFEQQVGQMGITLEDDAFEGPAIEQFGGVDVALLRLKIKEQISSDQQNYGGIDVALGIIDQGNGNITAVRYSLQGAPNDTVYADFRTWLEENAPRLATLEPEAAATEAAPQQ